MESDKLNPIKKIVNKIKESVNKIHDKITNKQGMSELIVVIMLVLIFSGVATYCSKALIGNKTNKTGAVGAGDAINTQMLNTIP